MADEETIKQAIAQAAMETSEAAIVAVNEESRRQATGIGHQSIVEVLRPQIGVLH